MTKVTFLFGAGASVGTTKRPGLPIVNQLPERIMSLIGQIEARRFQLRDYFKIGTDRSEKSKKEYHKSMISDMKWVSEHASKHASVDTFAKKLFLKKDEASLSRLKNALSIFFILEQSRNSVDIRYDAFFASILNEDTSKFPENIRVLSWNYDYQFEKAFSMFSDENDLGKNQKLLNVVSKFSIEVTPPGFTIIKINGTTGYGGKAHGEPVIHNFVKDFDLNSKLDANLFEKVVERYFQVANKFKDSVYPTLSFAWERSELGESNIIDKAIACTQDTDVLVVIGYSFPFFNREVDRAIIGAMKNLSKVYFQAPDAENIKTRFQAVRSNMLPKDLVAYPEVGSFLLPDEL